MNPAPISRINLAPLAAQLEDDVLILVPNHRLRDAILTTYTDAKAEGVFRTPRVFAVDIWLREFWDLCAHNGLVPCCERALLTPEKEQLLWTRVIESSLDAIPLLNPEETGRSASHSYRELRQWVLQDPIAALRGYSAIPDVAAFVHWLRDYTQRCELQQSTNLVDAIDSLLNHGLDSPAMQALLPSSICLVNFLQPPPLYRRLFDALAAHCQVSEMHLTQQQAPAQSWRESYATQSAELIACAHWARALRREQPGTHIGILYAEDFLSQPALRHIFETALTDENHAPLSAAAADSARYNTTSSRLVLTDAASIHDALLLLQLGQEEQASSDLCRLLQSPHLLATESEHEARLQMELTMRRYFTATTTMTDFCWHLNQAERATYSPTLAAVLLQLRTRQRQRSVTASAREWVRRWREQLAELGWPGVSGPQEQDNLRLWQETLDRFARCSAVLGPLTLSAALTRLRNLCQQQPQSHPFDARNPLSIYTVAEAVGLQFDHVWLLGFSDRHWPPPARPLAFLPYRLQVEAGIPASHSDLQFARASEQLTSVQGAVRGTLIASHHRTDGELELSPSSALLVLPERETAATELTPPNLLSSLAVTPTALVRINDTGGVPLIAGEQVRGGQGVISNQSSCPFRAFTRHRLRAEPLARFETGLSAMARGNALHASLETLFATVTGSAALAELTPTARKQQIATATETGIQWLSQRYPQLMTPRFKALEHTRIEALLQRYLTLEAERPEFAVVAREQVHEWHHGTLGLQLKIDRVDRLANESLALIDYKTGKRAVSSSGWIDARPEDMQLPLYYTVATNAQASPVTAIVIGSVNVERIAYSGVAAGNDFHASVKPASEDRRVSRDWNDLTRQWQMTVTELTAEFVGGRADVAPVNGRRTCEYCGLEPLCRIRELDQSEPNDDSVEDEA